MSAHVCRPWLYRLQTGARDWNGRIPCQQLNLALGSSWHSALAQRSKRSSDAVSWHHGDMQSSVREARLQLGLSMRQLGRLMGVSATSVASLERNEAQGTAQKKNIREALVAMGKDLRLDTLDAEASTTVSMARTRAEKIVRSAMGSMSLEGQALPPEAFQRLYDRAFRNEIEKL